jgi:hypothetical protein
MTPSTNEPKSVPPFNPSPTPNSAPSPNDNDANNPNTTYRPARANQLQMVSYEEFQRLPGTIVSSPVSVSASSNSTTSNDSSLNATPQMLNAPTKLTARPANLLPPSNFGGGPTQQAVWVPAQ